MELENQFDLNECFIYTDQKNKHFQTAIQSTPLFMLSDWKAESDQLFKMVCDSEKTMDINEAVMDHEELQQLLCNGIEWDNFPLIPNQKIDVTVNYNYFQIKFSYLQDLADQLNFDVPGLKINVEKKQRNYCWTINGDLSKIVNDGFRPLLQTIFTENLDYFFSKIKEFNQKNQQSFTYPTWFLLLKIQTLKRQLLEQIEFNNKIINGAALNELSGQSRGLAEKAVQEGRKRLIANYAAFPKYYYYAIMESCLTNSN